MAGQDDQQSAGRVVMAVTPYPPHTLTAEIDRYGDLRFKLVCPGDERDDRPCKMGSEPDRCDWQDWENGEHHPDCACRKDRNAKCSGGDGHGPEEGSFPCWPAVPDECDGFYSSEVGHCHPTRGCWAIEILNEVGFEEGVRWSVKDVKNLTLPTLVEVGCEEDCVFLSPVASDASPSRSTPSHTYDVTRPLGSRST